MEHLQATRTASGIHVEWFPDAHCIVKLEVGGEPRRLAVMGAHLTDLEFAAKCIDLRNKHVAHDDNAYLQSTPIAVAKKDGVVPKIPRVACVTAIADTLDQRHWASLDTLIARALTFVAE